MTRLWRVGLVALGIFLACGPSSSVQAPSLPVGTIVGRVTSLQDGTALAGVRVTVLNTDGASPSAKSALTDSEGSYALPALAGGATYRVRFSLDGHVARFADVAVPDAAGEYPQGNAVVVADIVLAPATGTVTGKVFAAGARPAVGAVVALDLRPAFYELVAQVVVGADGTFTLSGLPGSPTGVPLTLVVQPWDESGDGLPDYGVVTTTAQGFPGIATRVDIDLRAAAIGLQLLASSVDDGLHPAGDAISLVFNRAIASEPLTVVLQDLTVNRPAGIGTALDASATELTVRPAGANTLAEAHDYRLTVTARALNGAVGLFTRLFTATGGSAPVPNVASVEVGPDDTDWNTNAFTLTWAAAQNAAGYVVYARDNQSNPAFVMVATVGNGPTPGSAVTLPPAFDAFTGDGMQTPFAFNRRVDFAVVAVNAFGKEGDLSAAQRIGKVDNVAPRVVNVVQSTSADNSAGSAPKELVLDVTFSEYMDSSPAAMPGVTLPSGVTVSSARLDPGLRSATFTLSIAAGTNGQGAITVTGGKDSSGNPMEQYDGVLRAVTNVIVNGGFESCNLTGWQAADAGFSTADVPAVVTSPVASGACAARLGNAAQTQIQYGNSQLSQAFTFPSAPASAINFSAQYRVYTNYSSPGHDTLGCYLFTSGGSFVQQLFVDYVNDPTWKTATASIPTYYAGQSMVLRCWSYQDSSHISGGYLDNVQILVTP